jgi:hypothetical protein
MTRALSPGRLEAYHFWVDGYPASVHSPGALAGFVGLLAAVAVVATSAVATFRRADMTV